MMISKRFDWYGVMARLSTTLALLSASATAGLGAYALLPERVQSSFPEWSLLTLGVIAVGSALLIPVATSFKQKRFQPDESDRAGA
jgi:hypothetical protein